jgi:hypothetical protein
MQRFEGRIEEMINCPHCEQPVDETVRTTCPLCFTPLRPEAAAAQPQPGVAPNLTATPTPGAPAGYGAAPQPPQMTAAPLYQPAPPPPGAPVQLSGMPLNAPGAAPLRGSNTRMTLNGDIIETPQTPSAAPMGGNYAGRPAATRPSYGASSARVEPKSRSGAPVAIVVVLLLLLGGGGFGGYYWWSHRTNPKDTVTKYLTAIKAQDWKTIYELTDLPDQTKAKFKDAQDFADKTKAQLSASPGASQMLDGLFSSLQFEVQDPKDNDGSAATVPIKVTINLLGRSMTQNEDVKLKNVGGTWKVSGGSNGMGLGGGMGLGSGGIGGGRMNGMGGMGSR